MNGIETQTIFSLLSIFTALSSLSLAVISLLRSKKKDSQTEGKNEGALASDIGYIKAGIDDLKRENRETRKEMQSSNERLTRCEESLKQAHKRIDGLLEYHKPHE